MKILLTGASGFLGNLFMQSWNPEHTVVTIGRSSGNNVVCDLPTYTGKLPPADLVVHAAGKAHVVPATQAEADDFRRVNVTGTENLLKALHENLPTQLVFISSVSVYGLHAGTEIDENTPLLAADPYGKSKVEAEALVREWGVVKSVPVLILRLPLIVGPNPPGNLGAMKRAIDKGYYFRIGDGRGRRSVVCGSDVARLIAGNGTKAGIFNLTDGYHPMIREMDALLAQKAGKHIRQIPSWTAKLAAGVGDIVPIFPLNSKKWQKLTATLTFSDRKARTQIAWNPHRFSDDPFFR